MKQRMTNLAETRLPSSGSPLGYLDKKARTLQQAIRRQEELIRMLGATYGDPLDEASKATQQAQSIAVLEQLRREWQQIQAARQSLAEGRYGSCQDCGQPISRARLKVLAYATRCVRCQTLRESDNKSRFQRNAGEFKKLLHA